MTGVLAIAAVVTIVTAAQLWSLAAGPARSGVVSWQRIAIAWPASAWLAGVLLRVADYVAAQAAAGRQRQLTLVDSLVGMAIVTAISFAIAWPVCRWGVRRGWRASLIGGVTLAINCVVVGFLTLAFLFLFSMPPH